MLTEWFTELIKALLTNEGNPVLRIIANIFGSFLIYTIYIVLAGLTQRLKGKFPDASNSLETQIVEKMLLWSTIVLMAFLLLTGIVVAFKALLQEILQSRGADASQISLKEAIVINLNHFKHVGLYVFSAVVFMVTLTAVEVAVIHLSRRYMLGDNP
jgi:cytochrome b subunit of formate dehydrogenase